MTNVAAESCSVRGVRVAATAAGIRKIGCDDVVLLEIAPGSTINAVFTRNAFCAAPVIVARRHLERAEPRYLLINSGNANAGTGSGGIQTAQTCCRLVAQATGCAPAEVLPFSTGVIGEPLPVARMDPAIRVACESLRADAWPEAAAAIMTTDTEPKLVSRQLQLGGRQVAITGIAKGAGMIRPDMATMLAFVATDVELRPVAARELLQAAADVSFNRITVDGDTSTNDACALVATGQSAASPIVDAASEAGLAFREALVDVCQTLAKWIVRDGEGASRLVAVEVSDAASEAEAREVAYTVAHSPLVKTAFTAGDPNWGRILAAVGRARVESLDVSGVSIFLDEACVIRKGEPAPEYREEQGARVMGQAEFTVRVSLSRGSAACTVWTCDLSAEYVRINAEYRT